MAKQTDNPLKVTTIDMKSNSGAPSTMRRRDALKTLAGLTLLATGSFFSGCTESTERPNILFIFIDDLNLDVDIPGNIIQTPFYDQLAQRGVRFERTYCQYPVCNPSRVSLFSGLYPTTTQVLDNITPPRYNVHDYVTLPQFLRGQKYQTAYAGKIFHLPDPASWEEKPPPPPTELDKGFNFWMEPVGQENADIADWLRSFMEPKTSDAESLKDYKIASEAILLMNELQASTKPFFLAVGFNLPHVPYDVPKEFYDLYANAYIRLPEDYKSLPGWKEVPEDAFRPNLDLFFEQSAWESKARELIKAYYACVSFMDAQIGRLLHELERLGLSENTIVAVASDNGYHLGQKGLWAKMTLFEHSARVPLIIADPRKKRTAGSRCQAITELIDLYPTLVELCGLEAPTKLEGQSLVRFLNDPQATRDRAASTVLLRNGKLAKSIRTSRWRYTEWDEGRRGTELYDHLNDPHETHNLANDREYTEIISMLKQQLRSGKF